jgi:ubiquinone/menaquinone biosynthesis C-methylase UbiE
MTDANARFVGSIPAAYHKYLGPMFFEPYAEDLASRASRHSPGSVLEVACGTGIVTAVLGAALPQATLIATDLNDAMLDFARAVVPARAQLSWRQADACALPFADAQFDVVACQFGLMFVPDKLLALKEARRVLRPDGWLLFNVWDSLQENPSAEVTRDTISGLFPDNPPTFYEVPFGLHDRELLHRLLTDAGFRDISLDTVTLEARAPSAKDAATGLVTGSPALTALQERGISDPAPVVDAVAEAIARVGGRAPFRVAMRAVVVSARA